MKNLSHTAYQKAVAFLKHEARLLERALYSYHFENGSSDDVLKELAHFQNEDGGFGHGLEPDVQLGDSSVIATTVAFQHLRELKVSADHPLVVNGCRYLRDTYNPLNLNWSIIPPNIDDDPHAPWWSTDSELMNRLINPRAEILGYVHEYAGYFSAEMRQTLAESVINHLTSHADVMEMHDLLCYIRLYETEVLPPAIKTLMFGKLQHIVNATVMRDPAQWRSYGLAPLVLIKSPDSAFEPAFRDVIPENLDFVVEQQGDDGTWSPNWTWGDNWPDAWQQAKNAWRGVLTLDNLRTLRAFGRIA